MKHLVVFYVLFCFSRPAFCQQYDSLAIARQVDSLLLKVNDFKAEHKYDSVAMAVVKASALLHSAPQLDTIRISSLILSNILFFEWENMPDAGDSLLRDAVALNLGKYGPDSIQYVRALSSRANFLRIFQRYDTAEALFRQAQLICKNGPPEYQYQYSHNLISMGHMYKEWGKYEAGESALLENLELVKKLYPPESFQYSGAINSLALFYLNVGRYVEAAAFYEESLALCQKLRGVDNPETVGIRHNLAQALYMLGRTEEALEVQGRAVNTARDNPKVSRISYAQELGESANYLLNLGRFEEAEKNLRQSIQIFEQEPFGTEFEIYGVSLSNLGAFYQDIGRSRESIDFHRRARLIYMDAQNLGLPAYLISYYLMNNSMALSENYDNQGLQDSTLWYLNDAVKFGAGQLGQHAEFTDGLLHIGEMYLSLGHFDEAKEQFVAVKNALENANLRSGSYYGHALRDLASICVHEGKLAEARALLALGKNVTGASLGTGSKVYAYTLIEQGNLLWWRLHEAPEAVAAYDSAMAIYRSAILDGIRFLPESELNSFVRIHLSLSQTIYSCAAASGGKVPALAALAADNTLFLKGFILETRLALNKKLAEAPDSIRLAYSHWKDLHNLLAAEYSKPPDERKNVDLFERQANDLEKALTRQAAALSSPPDFAHWKQVQERLQPGEAAVEFIRFKVRNPEPADSTLYAALVLRPDWPAPEFVALFEEGQIDSLLRVSGERKADYVNQLYTLADRGASPVNKPRKSLYELLWQPLENALTGVRTIFYAPAGLLYRLNLAAIPVSVDSVLGDRYQLVELGSTRQLVAAIGVRPAGNDALLYGGITYEADGTALAQANAVPDSVSIVSRGELDFAYTDSTLRQGSWAPLPFTDREVGSVEKTLRAAGFQAETRGGYAATEEAFKRIGADGKPSPRVLHIATHGFFFPDPGGGMRNTEYGMRNGEEPVFKISDHPMIRSGLILAGANHAWTTGKPIKEGMEDGILTAYEISQMNLSNTELVVLSACETGLGDIQGNEGVYGLQRAFKIAGAKYLIMSLWQVPDKQTSLLMTTFYKKWLEEKMPIPEAFRAAQKALRDAGLDPYQWAGFVLVE